VHRGRSIGCSTTSLRYSVTRLRYILGTQSNKELLALGITPERGSSRFSTTSLRYSTSSLRYSTTRYAAAGAWHNTRTRSGYQSVAQQVLCQVQPKIFYYKPQIFYHLLRIFYNQPEISYFFTSLRYPTSLPGPI